MFCKPGDIHIINTCRNTPLRSYFPKHDAVRVNISLTAIELALYYFGSHP